MILKKYSIYETIQILIVILFLYFLFFFNDIYYLPITDYLDQFYAQKQVKLRHFNFFNVEELIPSLLNGLNYNYLPPSEFHFETVLEYVFGMETSHLIIQLLGKLSIFLLSIKLLSFFIENLQINIVSASFIAFSDFWPFMTLTIFCVLILLNIVINNSKLSNQNLLILSATPLLYEIYLGGIWISVFLFIYLFKLFLRLKENKYIYASILHLTFIVLSSYRLFFEIIFGEETNRVTNSLFFNKNKFSSFIQDFILINFDGHWHYVTSNKYFVAPLVFLYLFYLVIKKCLNYGLNEKENLFIKIFFVIQIFNIFYALDHSKFFDLNSIFGLTIHLQRAVVFNHILWGVCLSILLSSIKSKNFIFFLFLLSFTLNGSAMWKVSQPSTFTKNENFATRQLIDLGQKINFVDYTLMTTWSNLIPGFSTYSSFYDTTENYYKVSLYSQIYKDYENTSPIFVSYNIDPMIAAYNNLNTADGYFNLYKKSYNRKFQEVIRDELDFIKEREKNIFSNYGPKVYLFNKQFYPSYDLNNINFCALRNLPSTHMISEGEISYKYIKLENVYDNIYVYKIVKPNNC